MGFYGTKPEQNPKQTGTKLHKIPAEIRDAAKTPTAFLSNFEEWGY